VALPVLVPFAVNVKPGRFVIAMERVSPNVRLTVKLRPADRMDAVDYAEVPQGKMTHAQVFHAVPMDNV